MTSNSIRFGLKRSALTVALGLCFAGNVHAQATTGSIYGRAAPGQTVTIVSDTGFTRTVTADANGRYTAPTLAAGHYKVTAGEKSQNVTVLVASGAQVDFAAAPGSLETVVVTGSRGPTIDVSQTDTRTVFTADQLKQMAVPRDVNAVALLAPGVINSTSYNSSSSNVGSFGGSAASENAYYINGYPVTNPLTSIGSSTLAFDSIAQEQVLLGGYGAEYGRSTGGVVSIVTKRGTNQWKGGIYSVYTPASMRSKAKDINYPDTGHWSAASHYPAYNTSPQNWTDGKLYDLNSKNRSGSLTNGFYVSGPLVPDHLFFYVNAERGQTNYEQSRVTGNLTGKTLAGGSAISSSNLAQAWGVYKDVTPRWTVKLDANISDQHTLEFTAIQDNDRTEGSYYGFNYDTNQRDGKLYGGYVSKTKSRLYVGKYTGYLTDNLSVSVMMGKQLNDQPATVYPGFDNSKMYIGISPTVVPNQYATIANPQKYGPTISRDGYDKSQAQRLDINYRLGNQELRAGYDTFEATSFAGDGVIGPSGYYWTYGLTNSPTAAIDGSHYVGSPASGGGLGAQGYYVTKSFFGHGGSTTVKQKALYVEDRWHVTDNFLLSLGLRKDGFTNYNGAGQPYVEQKRNWAPRIGFSWDVKGDSSFKVFGNMGRYHLALPNNVSVRGSNPSLNSAIYYTYDSIAADGTPVGLHVIPYTNANSPYTCADGSMSSNVECGYPKDPRTIAQIDLKPHYQDEFIIGMERKETASFAWGAKGTYRELKSAIDDICPSECFIFNAGSNSATFWEDDGTGKLVKVTHDFAKDFGSPFPKLKRKYAALDLYAQYDKGKFLGRVDYTFSRNWGNAEGQLNSSVDTGKGGQADVSVTQDWDLPELMFGKDGLLPNNRTHQIKAIASWRFSSQFAIGGSAIVQSGRPVSCTSYWPYAKPGLYNGAYYAYCGVPGAQTAVTTPGATPNSDYVYSARGDKGNTPWVANLNLNFTYTPSWAKGFRLSADVLNLLNRQVATAYYERSASSRTLANPRYGQTLYYSSPRYFRFTASYDF